MRASASSDAITDFQILNIMNGVTLRGTAAQLAALGRPHRRQDWHDQRL
jgi:hypothetical protein